MISYPVLLVEDDENLREAISDTLKLEGIPKLICESAEKAMEVLESQIVSMVVTDVNLPAKSGFDLLDFCKINFPHLPILMMTAFGSIDRAVDAMKVGAVDYLPKPFEPSRLIDKVRQFALKDTSTQSSLSPIVQDRESVQLLEVAKKVAQTDATVLIMGESGTGKEVLSRFIHDNSARSQGPFVAINCAAIPENMLEAILFGHEKGAFTGAHQSAPGKFELANTGTILLDEISEMDLGLQAKLLRVIQEQEVERIGSKKAISLDVRILATTNRDLKLEVKENRFREDLFYRLNVFPLKWKPLRERRDDIAPIANALLTKHTSKETPNMINFSEEALSKLTQYEWPGNIRELDNVIQRALILQNGRSIEVSDLMFIDAETAITALPEENSMLGDDLKKREFEIILDTLRGVNGSRRKTADKLGISERTLRYKLAKMRDSGVDLEEALS